MDAGPQVRTLWLGLAALAILLVAGLVALNVLLFRRNVQAARDMAALRLDPTAAAEFEDANRRLPAPGPGEVRIVYFGDSRIQGWTSLPPIAGAQGVNRGLGGETTAQSLLRLERDVIALAPQVVVLETGINDLKTIGVFPRREAAIGEACLGHCDSLIARLRARGAHVVVLTVFPPGRVPLTRRPIWSERIRAAVDDVNRRLRERQGPGVTVVDCDSLFLRDGRMDARYELDTLHLNEAGYAALGRRLQPTLEQIVARLRAGA